MIYLMCLQPSLAFSSHSTLFCRGSWYSMSRPLLSRWRWAVSQRRPLCTPQALKPTATSSLISIHTCVHAHTPRRTNSAQTHALKHKQTVTHTNTPTPHLRLVRYAGHSKWHNIKYKKAAADAKRAPVVSKHAQAIKRYKTHAHYTHTNHRGVCLVRLLLYDH